MAEATTGDTVKVHYTGTMQDGSVFDSSRERGPLEFTLGEGRLIPGFEQAVEGMAVGDTTTVVIAPAEGYGERNLESIVEVGREQMPEGFEPSVGDQLQIQTGPGNVLPATITAVSDETVTLDANHPLAGETLTFEIELVEIA